MTNEIKPVFGAVKQFRKQYNPRAARMERERLRKEKLKKKEEEEQKRKEEEDKRREEELNEVESDHHGRIFIDYSQPRAKYVPQNYEFSQQILVARGTFAAVYMCTIEST